MRKVLITLTLLLAGAMGLAQGVSVWSHFGDTDLEWLQAEAAAFEAAFGVPVTITRIELSELKQKMLLSAPEGEAADLIVTIPHDQIGELAAGGVIADMSSFATEDYLADLSDQAELAFTFNGRPFGLPLYSEGPALIVNADIIPESDMPATYEDFIAKAQELTSEDSYGFLFDNKNFYFAYNWLRSNGGYVFNLMDDGSLDPADVGLANEGAIAGARQLKALQYDHGLIPAGTDTSVAEGLFNEGAAAMVYNGPWSIANARAAGINLRVAPIPPMADGTEFAGFIGVQGVLLNEFSENKADAANFARWITRPDAQVKLAELSGRIPTSAAAAEQVADDPVLTGFISAFENAEPMPNIPEMGNVWQPMADALEILLKDADSDPEALLEAAVAQISGE
jgi:arabinogalactan oligomer/maltooligosaccharide transport system substrate-binding protein